jgi:hypothetical protein
MKDQFNGNTEKRHPQPHLTSHEVYEMVKDVHVVLGKQQRTCKNTKEDDMWKKQSIFWELPYWKDLDVSRLILFPDLKVAPGVKSHDYHVLLT